jgi:2,3-bisphosphoglycerate-independent phosphoglycerate mutase
MADFTAGHIGSEEAAELMAELGRRLGRDGIEFHAGVSDRHLMVWRGGEAEMTTTPPHDIVGQPTADHLPRGAGAGMLRALMQRAREVLADHEVNRARAARGQRRADSIWLWGQGRRPSLPTLHERFGFKGSVVAAVDLVKGIGVLSGLRMITVPGATGFLDTNFLGKAEAGLAALEEGDFLFLHVEAPDEAGHMGSAQKKVEAIENFDRLVVGTILEGLARMPAWRVLVMPDHATPLALRTHSADPVPFAVLSSAEGVRRGSGASRGYNETSARRTGVVVPEAWTIMDGFVRGGLKAAAD